MKSDENIFLTGQAGTGKTHTINKYMEWAKKQGLEVMLTASTGIAAINIKGITIHTFLGSKISNTIEQYDNLKIPASIWNETTESINLMDVLVVDEVSMLSASFIDLMDYILQKATKTKKPFGGKKVIFTGDFLQLPPISKVRRTFAFESQSWKDGHFKILNLTKIYRQNDITFANMLSKVRLGDSANEVFEYFNQFNKNKIDWNDDSVKLFSRNEKVNEFNMKELNAINGEKSEYFADTWGETLAEETKLIKNVIADEILELKVGARVISLKNSYDGAYVNGSLGTVVELNPKSVKVEFDNGYTGYLVKEMWETTDKKGDILATFEQIPLKLAYALTIHKSQGMTIDKLTIDCSDIFEEGQFYVAISRVIDTKNLTLIGFKKYHIRANQKAVAYYKQFLNNNVNT